MGEVNVVKQMSQCGSHLNSLTLLRTWADSTLVMTAGDREMTPPAPSGAHPVVFFAVLVSCDTQQLRVVQSHKQKSVLDG